MESQVSIEYWATHPDQFKELDTIDQLSIIADIAQYWREQESKAWETDGKSSVAAKRCRDKAKYWESTNQNLKKIAELRAAEIMKFGG